MDQAEEIAPEQRRPTWEGLRHAVNAAAMGDGEWAGAPMPLPELRLRVEPRYPYAGLNGYSLGGPLPAEEADGDVPVVHNSWYSTAHSATVYVCSDTADSPRYALLVPEWGGKRLACWINTVGASRAWDLGAEANAMETLGTLLSRRAMASYMLTGTFLETSKRSGVVYLFRRLRPTVAIRANSHGSRILACLCMHPIGYYEESFGGVMVPSDDVLAHVLLMRSDERRYWSKCNHHPSWSAGAGI